MVNPRVIAGERKKKKKKKKLLSRSVQPWTPGEGKICTHVLNTHRLLYTYGEICAKSGRGGVGGGGGGGS